MFMDPRAFEAEDIEKELVDAGIESDTKTAEESHNGDRIKNPLEYATGAGADGASYSSTATLRKSNDFNGIPPDTECQTAPTYGRHGKVSGTWQKPRPQMAPPASTPSQGNSHTARSASESLGNIGNLEGSNRGIRDRGLGGEGKFGEKSSDGSPGSRPSSTGGNTGRARVLVQQREIQRKKRLQALRTTGGIRVSDAVSLSRGFVLNSPGVYRESTDRGVSPEDEAGVDQGKDDVTREGVEEEDGSSFSTAVKQFSAPRQVGSSNRRSSDILSEFERRRLGRKAGHISDDYDDEGYGGKSTPDMSSRVKDEGDRDRDDNTTNNTGGRRSNDSVSRPEDWDKRLCPSSKTFRWGSDSENGDDSRAESAAADSNVAPGGQGDKDWRSFDGGRGSPTTPSGEESRDWVNRDRSSAPSSEHSPKRSSAGSSECRSDRTPKCLSENNSERSPRRSSDRSSDRSRSLSRSRSPFRSERSCSVSPSDDHNRRGERHRFEMKSPPQGRRHSLNTLSAKSKGARYRGRTGRGQRKAASWRGRRNRSSSLSESDRGRDPSSEERSLDRSTGEGNRDGQVDDDRERFAETKGFDGYQHRDAGKGRGLGDSPSPSHDEVAAQPLASSGGGNELEFNMSAIDLSDMKTFLRSPCPRAAGIVQCYIRRNKTGPSKLFPEYSLFMKEGDRFLMSSKKRPNKATSNYLISMRAGDLDRGSPNFLGKLRANFVGTEFQVFDDGCNPREHTGAFGWSKRPGSGAPVREELGCVLYASNVLGSRGPRKMQVAIPPVDDDGVVSKWSETFEDTTGSSSGTSKVIERLKNRDYGGSLHMVNKPPRWNEQVGAYVLNFYGRVTMASVKNFQLVSTEDFDRITLQFGRVAKDEFTMDFQYPLSPFQAFAITLSSFDSKIACD